MYKKNLLSNVLAVIITSVAAAGSPKYPSIIKVEGQVLNLVTSSDKKNPSPVKLHEVLREKAHLSVGPKARVQIQLDADRVFTLRADTELQVPAISWDSGEVPVLNLKRGSIEWKQAKGGKSAYNTVISSPLFQFIAPGGHYSLTIDPRKAWAQAQMFEGQMVFSALNAEESVQISSGQQVDFQGQIEDDEIAYDVLLQGRRIPKGALGKVVPLNLEDHKRLLEEEKVKRAQVEAQKKQEKAKALKLKKDGAICDKPFGRLNDCSWTCTNKKKNKQGLCLPVENQATLCVRHRCNANGDWAEATDLSVDQAAVKCKSETIVSECDY